MRRLLTVVCVWTSLWLFGPTTIPPDVAWPSLRGDRPILLYDPSGDGRIVEAVGDLGRAERIAVLVPGVDVTLGNFYTGHGGLLRRSPSWQARDLYGQMHTVDPSARIGVVAWLAYDPPEGIGPAAVREDRAAAGAGMLRSFVDALVALRPTAVITIVGHSYGAVVVGLAAPRLDPHVVNLVVLGCPGLGVDRAVELDTRARVWAGTAAGDWTRRLPGIRIGGAGHGTHPTDPSFGALALPVDGVESHDGYFVPGTASLRAMADITLGRL